MLEVIPLELTSYLYPSIPLLIVKLNQVLLLLRSPFLAFHLAIQVILISDIKKQLPLATFFTVSTFNIELFFQNP